MATRLTGTITGFPSCCGADIIHGLGVEETPSNPRPNALPLRLAVTNPSQTESASALEREGFKKVLTWTGGHGTELTLWARGETMKKVILPKKSSGATSRSTKATRNVSRR